MNLKNHICFFFVLALFSAVCLSCNGIIVGRTPLVESCDECGDTRIVEEDCENCDGTGEVNCDECDGYGHIVCPECEGTGENCDYCSETGEVECSNCYGSGTLECGECEGTGIVEMPCPYCCGEDEEFSDEPPGTRYH